MCCALYFILKYTSYYGPILKTHIKMFQMRSWNPKVEELNDAFALQYLKKKPKLSCSVQSW